MLKQKLDQHRASIKAVLLIVMATVLLLPPLPAYAAACPAPTTNYGSATNTVSVPTSATYRIWSRIMVPDQSNNTYLLEVDGNNCFNVGGGALTANTWNWVDYKDGNTAAKVDVSLAAGTHTLKLIGNKPNVKLDRVVLVSDLSCTVKDLGDTCVPPADTTVPTVSLSAPANGATVSGTADLQATASDNVGVTRVDFLDNSSVIGSVTTAPYNLAWNTMSAANGEHSLTAKAYDAAGNVAVATRTVTVKNGDQTAPTAPTNPKATATEPTKVTLTWTASTDNTGVTGYTVKRNGAVLQQVGTVTTLSDAGLSPNTTYNYTLTAHDAAGNTSAASAIATVKTPALPTADTTAPTVPASVTATAVSSSQINLKWNASTDATGVTAYDVYRSKTGTTEAKIATVTSTSYGDTGLSAQTEYSYRVRARDAASNQSAFSTAAKATTTAKRKVVTIRGSVLDSYNTPIKRARIVHNNAGKKTVYSAQTNGRYELKFANGGEYKLSYLARRYESKVLTFRVKDGDVIVRDVRLSRN